MRVSSIVFTLGFVSLAASAYAYTCTNTVAPTITFIDSASDYGGYSYFGPGSWLEIKGSNLADPNDPRIASGTGEWAQSDFNGAAAPTNLDGISATVNGKPAFIAYISPGQINVQTPQDSANGSVIVTVTNCHATSSPVTFSEQGLAPGMLAPPDYSANGKQYLVATFVSDESEVAYVLDTSIGASFGLNSRPAKPGDLIIAYGVGFGPVSPPVLPGNIVTLNNSVTNPVTVSFGSTPANLSYKGLAPEFVGLYEFYITVPQGLPSGDYPIIVTQNGVQLPQPTYYLTVGTASTPAAQLESFTLSPSLVTGGTNTAGTVELSAPAPAGGAVVTLNSSSTAATVPSSVTLPVGSALTNFNVTTSAVNANTNATITASYGGISISAVLTITKSSGGGGGILPPFNLMSVTPNITSTNTSSLGFSFDVGGAGCAASGTALGANPGFTFGAVWSGYTLSGTTITCTGLETSDTASAMTQTNGKSAEWTSATLTFTLNPQNNFSGTVTSGTLSLTSSLATVTASFTGTYETE